MQYELFYLVGASKEAELDKIKQEVAAIVTAEGGVFAEKQVVEKRKMAYEVKHENRGFYVAQRFELEDASRVQAINRKLGLYTNILRVMITRADELPELTSREEREAKATREVRTEIKKPIRVEEKAKVVASVTESKTEEAAPAEEAPVKAEKLDEEDINKKLEEILNI